MPSRVHRYDRPSFQATLPNHFRRIRKAFYFIERLRQIDPEFNQKIIEIKYKTSLKQITPKEADQQASQAILQAIQREKQGPVIVSWKKNRADTTI